MGNPGSGSIRGSTVGLTELTVDAEDGTTELFGKLVSALQSDVAVSGGKITGTLAYVDDYTGFSGDPDLQKGNFLALKFSAASGTTVKVKLEGGEGAEVTLDEDMNAVFRVTDAATQKVTVTAVKGIVTDRRTFDISGLTLEEEE